MPNEGIVIAIRKLNRFEQGLLAGMRGNHAPWDVVFKRWAARYRSDMAQRFARLSRGGGEWPALKPSTIRRRLARGMARLRQAHARGDITTEQFQRRMKTARSKYKREVRLMKPGAMKHELLSRLGKTFKSLKKRVASGAITQEQATAGARRAVASHRKKMASVKAGTFQAAILRDTGTLMAALTPQFIGAPGQFEQAIPFGIRVGYGGPSRHPNTRLTVAGIAAVHQLGGKHLPARKTIVAPSAQTQRGMASDVNWGLTELRKAVKL